MKRILLTVLPLLLVMVVKAQLLTWTPPFPKENDPAQTLVITMDATKGNRDLLNYTPVTDVYVHIGVITNLSTAPNNWLYVPFTWGTTASVAQAASLGNNKWTYTINGSLKSFFNITDPNEHILKIAILFRNGAGGKVQRNADGSDMYIPVYTNDLAVRIDLPAREPKYIPSPEPQSWTLGSNFSIEAKASSSSTMKLYHNGVLLNTLAGVQSITANSSVTALGNQQIIAEANDGTTTKYDTINIFVAPPASPVAALPAGVIDGINYEPGDTSAILVLHAPGKNLVTVIGDFNNWTQDTVYIMRKTPDGNKFWLRLKGLQSGTEYAYQYVVDDTIKIADPYTEKVLDPWNDQWISSTTYPGLKPYPTGQEGIVSIVQTGQVDYNWSVTNFSRPDKRGLVIYELLVRDFIATHDWKTLKDTLNYLKSLGVNAVEIMPFNEFEGNESWGYNPDFYFAPDKYYGPANTLKQFVDSCHKNGIAVIMDIALNHSFGLSPMVQLYWDEANNRPAANNPWYNPTPRHPFNVGFDFNHESLDTRYFTSRVVAHWLQKYKIDGFRFDLSKGFTQVNSGNDVGLWGNYDASRVAIWKRYYDTVQTKAAGAYVILEHFAANNEEIELSNYGMLLWGNHNFHYALAAMGKPTESGGTWNFEGVIHSVRGWSQPHLVGYMESHDEERLMRRTLTEGNASGSYNTRDTTTALKRMGLDAAFFLTIPGPKMIWEFGEMGYDYSINYCPDGTINNNCRTSNKPIRWDYLQDARRKELFDVYSKLIKLRSHTWYKDLFQTGTTQRDLGGAFKWLKMNSGDSSYIVVVGNFDVVPSGGNVTFPTSGTWFDYLNNTTYTATGGVQVINLNPGEYRVYVNRNVNNISTTPVINLPSAPDAISAKVYPNPSKRNYYVDLELPQNIRVTIELLNSVGQTLETVYTGTLPRGKQLLHFNRHPLTNAGNYYLRITTKSGTKILQLVHQ